MTRLHMANLQAGYGNKRILNDISLSVEEGEMIALLPVFNKLIFIFLSFKFEL